MPTEMPYTTRRPINIFSITVIFTSIFLLAHPLIGNADLFKPNFLYPHCDEGIIFQNCYVENYELSSNEPESYSYTGEINRSNEMDGYGKLISSNGSTWEGYFVNNNLVYGESEWFNSAANSRTKYIGQYNNNQDYHGKGIFFLPNDRIVSGIWENGEYLQNSKKTSLIEILNDYKKSIYWERRIKLDVILNYEENSKLFKKANKFIDISPSYTTLYLENSRNTKLGIVRKISKFALISTDEKNQSSEIITDLFTRGWIDNKDILKSEISNIDNNIANKSKNNEKIDNNDSHIYWSNLITGPINIDEAKKVFEKKSPEGLEGIWEYPEGMKTIIVKQNEVFKEYIVEIERDKKKYLGTLEATYIPIGKNQFNFFQRVWYPSTYEEHTMNGKATLENSHTLDKDYFELSKMNVNMDGKLVKIWPSNLKSTNKIDSKSQNRNLLITIIVITFMLFPILILRSHNLKKTPNSLNPKIKKEKDIPLHTSNKKNEIVKSKTNYENKKSNENKLFSKVIDKDSNLSFSKNNKIVKVNEMSDEQIYEIIAEEFDSNRRKGLWLKCEIECDMDEIKAKKLYVQTRFQEIKSLEQIEVDDNNSIKQEEEEVNPTLKALIDLRFKEELTEDSYNKLDKNFKKELLKYIFSVVEQYLNIQKSAVQTVGQKIQKDDTERNFLIYILFEYGCIDGMCLILNISPEVGQKIAIEVYNLQNQTFPEKKFDAAKRKDAIGELLTNKDTLEIAREIHQKGIKSVSRFLIDQDDKASLDIINFLNDEDIQFNFSNSDTAENNIQELLNKLAEFYNHYKTDLLGNPTRLKKFGKEQFENIVQYKRYFEEAANHYNEDGDIFMAITKAKTSLILFSLCQAETIEEVDKDLEELLSSGKLINLSEKLMSSARYILGRDENQIDIDEDEINSQSTLDEENEINDSEYTHPNSCTMGEFEEKIKMAIPVHEVPSLPRIGDVEGNPFSCGCGETHYMNFEEHLFIADMGMFKALFLSKECGYLNALKLKKMFSSSIENLFNTKFRKNEPNYGFQNNYPDIVTAINISLRLE